MFNIPLIGYFQAFQQWIMSRRNKKLQQRLDQPDPLAPSKPALPSDEIIKLRAKRVVGRRRGLKEARNSALNNARLSKLLPATVVIDKNRLAAKKHARQECEAKPNASRLVLWTDGSYKPKISSAGATVVRRARESGEWIGTTFSSDIGQIQDAELFAISAAMQIAKNECIVPETGRSRDAPSEVVIYSDSASCLKQILNWVSRKKRSEHSQETLLRHIYDCATALAIHHVKLSFRWVPAHSGVEGNVVADFEAGQAALRTFDSKRGSDLSPPAETDWVKGMFSEQGKTEPIAAKYLRRIRQNHGQSSTFLKGIAMPA